MAITTFSQNVAAFFPAGTSLGAYPESNYPAAHRPPTAGVAPLGAATATASVDSAGLVSFTGLADSTVYYLSDSGGTKHIRITTLPSTVTENVGHKDRANGYPGLDAGGLMAASELPAGLPKVVESPGASTDVRATIQALIDAANPDNGGNGIIDLQLGRGTFLLNATGPLSLFRSASKVRISGAGVGATTIKLSATCPRAFDFNKVADHDTFQNIEISDLTVDANSIGGSHHVVIGTLQAGTFQSRLNVANLALRRVRTVNVAGDATNTIDRRNVALIVRHPADDEATQDTITDVLCEDCDFSNGGSYGIQWGGTSPGNSANVYSDRIRLVRCKHDTGQTYTASHGGANFFGPSAGFGGSVVIRDCLGKRSGDVGIEIDAMEDALVDGTVIEDAVTANFFSRNFHTPDSQSGQTHRYQNCTSKVVTLNPDVGNSLVSRGFQIGHASAPTPTLGHVILDKCTVRSVQTNFSLTGAAIYCQDFPVERITVRDFTADFPSISYTPTANRTGDMARLFPTGTAHVDIRNITLKSAGTVTGGFAAQVGGIKLSASGSGTVSFVIDGYNIFDTVSGTGSSVGEKLRLGQGTGTMRGVVRRLDVCALTAAPQFGGDILYVQDTGTLTIPSNKAISIEKCDFSKITGTTSNPITFAGTNNRAKVRIEPDNVLNLGVYASSTQPNIASATTVTLPHAGDYFVITGTTTITSITASWAERLVTLNFSGVLTFTDGSNLLLAGNLSTTADDQITLRCDGTNWIEVGRSVN